MRSLLRALCNFTAGEGPIRRGRRSRGRASRGGFVVQRLVELVLRPPAGEPRAAGASPRATPRPRPARGGPDATPIRARPAEASAPRAASRRGERPIRAPEPRGPSRGEPRGPFGRRADPAGAEGHLQLLPCSGVPPSAPQDGSAQNVPRGLAGPRPAEPAQLQLSCRAARAAASSDEGRDFEQRWRRCGTSSRATLSVGARGRRHRSCAAVCAARRQNGGARLGPPSGARAAGAAGTRGRRETGDGPASGRSGGRGASARASTPRSGSAPRLRNAWSAEKENERPAASSNARRPSSGSRRTVPRGQSVSAAWAAVRANSAVALWALVHKFSKAAGRLSYEGRERALLVASQAELQLELSGADAQQRGVEARLLRGTLDAIESVLALADSV